MNGMDEYPREARAEPRFLCNCQFGAIGQEIASPVAALFEGANLIHHQNPGQST